MQQQVRSFRAGCRLRRWIGGREKYTADGWRHITYTAHISVPHVCQNIKRCGLFFAQLPVGPVKTCGMLHTRTFSGRGRQGRAAAAPAAPAAARTTKLRFCGHVYILCAPHARVRAQHQTRMNYVSIFTLYTFSSLDHARPFASHQLVKLSHECRHRMRCSRSIKNQCTVCFFLECGQRT